MEKEYNSGILIRAITAFVIILPLFLIIYLENTALFVSAIILVCFYSQYEWIINKFEYPIIFGFFLIFICFGLGIVYPFLHYENLLNLEINLNFFRTHATLFYLFLIVVLNTALFDTFAYLVGSSFGKTPIAPRISPNKTYEGLIGGFLFNIIFGIAFCNFLSLSYMYILCFVIGGFLAFIGDLFISVQKRKKGIKDTGNILPGHGGMLDRLDSHLLATPVTLWSIFILEKLLS